MSVRIIIPSNDVNNGDALGYSDKLGNKKTVDRDNHEPLGAYSMYLYGEQNRFVSISGATGDTTLVSGIPNRQISIDNYTFVCDNKTDVSFMSGSNFMSGPMAMESGAGISTGGSDLMRTNAGEDLIINSTSSSIHGTLAYRIM